MVVDVEESRVFQVKVKFLFDPEVGVIVAPEGRFVEERVITLLVSGSVTVMGTEITVPAVADTGDIVPIVGFVFGFESVMVRGTGSEESFPSLTVQWTVVEVEELSVFQEKENCLVPGPAVIVAPAGLSAQVRVRVS